MQFVSFAFLSFMPVAVLINFIVPQRYRYIWLLFTSLIFYLSLDVRAFAVLAVTVLLNYGGALFMGKQHAAGKKPLPALICTVAMDAAMLLVFRSGSTLGAIGISFYMLKTIGYLVDVYRGDFDAEKNFAKFALFVSFFPQVISGPIDRAENLIPQFEAPASIDFDRLRYGILKMLWGYILKLVIADRLAIFVGAVFDDPAAVPGTIVFLATIFYSFEIYCDFAGYSNIAIGTAGILGIDVKKNFDLPYMARDIPEFWRRWHISLSTWFRDYVYIPLGGNRKGRARRYLNILIVFALSGIWHGTALTFLVWGLLHGIYQIVGYILMPLRDKVIARLRIERQALSHRIFKKLVTFILVNTAWIFFRADSLATAVLVLRRSFMFTPWALIDGSLYALGLNFRNFVILVMGLTLLILVDVLENRKGDMVSKVLSQRLWVRWPLMISGVLIVLIFGLWGPMYNASSFIYQQF